MRMLRGFVFDREPQRESTTTVNQTDALMKAPVPTQHLPDCHGTTGASINAISDRSRSTSGVMILDEGQNCRER